MQYLELRSQHKYFSIRFSQLHIRGRGSRPKDLHRLCLASQLHRLPAWPWASLSHIHPSDPQLPHLKSGSITLQCFAEGTSCRFWGGRGLKHYLKHSKFYAQ